MGLDNREYARKRRLDWDSNKSATAIIEPSYYGAVRKGEKPSRWFILPTVFAFLAMSPLIVSTLHHAGVFQLNALDALENKIFLPPDSKDHYVFLGAAGILFLLAACVLFTFRASTVLVFSAFTILGAVGSIWLLKMLWAAAAHSWPPQGSGFSINGFLYAIKSGYASLHRPGGEMQGYIFGVGVAEELAKLVPVFIVAICQFSSRVRLISAFALGVGFGLAEGVLYSETMYNGNSPVTIYFVRFLSLAALHGMWTTIAYGSFSVFKNKAFQWFDQSSEPVQLVFFLAALALAPAVLLHGLYDVYIGTPNIVVPLVIVGLTCLMFGFIVYQRRASIVRGEWFKA